MYTRITIVVREREILDQKKTTDTRFSRVRPKERQSKDCIGCHYLDKIQPLFPYKYAFQFVLTSNEYEKT